MTDAGSVSSEPSESLVSTSTDPDKSSTANEFTPKEEAEFKLAEKETQQVKRTKAFVFLTLLACAAALGFVTYHVTARTEENHFENQFEDYAYEVIEIAHHEAINVFAVLGRLSIETTSLAVTTNASWPNFTSPHWSHRAGEARHLSESKLLVLSPYVTTEERTGWEAYAAQHTDWIDEGLEYEALHDGHDHTHYRTNESVPYFIHGDTNGAPYLEGTAGPFSPIWETSPVPRDTSIVNFDVLSVEEMKGLEEFVDANEHAAMSGVIDPSKIFGNLDLNEDHHPESVVMHPILRDFGSHDVVAHYMAVVPWDIYFDNILHKGSDGIIVVMEDSCSDMFTYQLDGPNATFLGMGDLHDTKYDEFVQTSDFAAFQKQQHITDNDVDVGIHCEYTIHVYPSDPLHEQYITNAPAIYTLVVVSIFVLTTMVFVLYDCLVTRRQEKTMNTAVKTNQIVASLFPETVRDQILSGDANGQEAKQVLTGKSGLKSFLAEGVSDEQGPDDGDEVNGYGSSKPIADLFPNTTVLFCDIVGFTAWSSVREPYQVFTLLETIFQEFDSIARKRGIFKVETVGDQYVAVTGLPEPRKDHAVAMARFARDCMNSSRDLFRKMEVSLGPDTGDLAMRFGLHSGPVTAGVLRGDRARFQLFGDTMNTAARMESTGQREKIHISQETADLLVEGGKETWFKLREDCIIAKGKGALETYWLLPKRETKDSERASTTDAASSRADEQSTSGDLEDGEDTAMTAAKKAASQKVQRLIDWNCDMLLQLLKKIYVRRDIEVNTKESALEYTLLKQLERGIGKQGLNVIDEVVEIIELPAFDEEKAKREAGASKVDLGEKVTGQLREFVAVLATLYRDNPFHCFEHASHVTMSVTKLLSRIVAPDDMSDGKALHDHTYGITSDPLTQFSVVLSALIHDIDHRGVSNVILCKEDPTLAAVYENKSVAEQNSVDLAWNALMDPSFDDLRYCIYRDEAELRRFRQLMVNSVMATDIFDKELNLLRKKRWETAFQEGPSTESEAVATNRKATIVIEHLIQASDVAHTMQHWHVYTKWNSRLFEEMYSSFLSGRWDRDPSEGWFQGEIGFFDNYVIPLARKLKECGVFGVSSDEYLNYATNNRTEWETKGESLVMTLVEKAQNKAEDLIARSPIPRPTPSETAPRSVGAVQA